MKINKKYILIITLFCLFFIFVKHASALTFGNTIAGASNIAISADDIYALLGAEPDSGSVTSLTAHIGDPSTNGAFNSKAIITQDLGLTIITNGIGGTVAVGSGDALAWKTMSYGTSPTIDAGNDYLLGVIFDTAGNISYDTGVTGNGTADTTNSYASPADWGSKTDDTRKYSIYVTYSCNTPTPSDFTYKKQITIEAGNTSGGYVGGVATTSDGAYVIVATTTDANLAATSSAGRIENVAENDGTDNDNEYPLDVAFFASDESTVLSFEIEDYASTTGALVAWVEVPSISSTTDQTIYMYYGYSGATGYSCAQEAWSGADYDPVGVWHLSESPPSTSTDLFAYDSTDNNNDGSFNGTMAAEDQVSGALDGSLDFDGGDDYVGIPENFGIFAGNVDFTFYAWIKPTAVDNSGLFVISVQGERDWKFGVKNTGLFAFEAWDGAVRDATSAYEANSWQSFVGVYDAADGLKLYKNGILAGSNSWTGTAAPQSRTSTIGSEPAAFNDYYLGLIDEVRIYSSALTQADITTIYNMENSNSTFLTWGAETEVSATVAGETTVIPWIIKFE